MNICAARWIASFLCLLCLGIPTYASADAWLLGGSADGEGSIFIAATGERWGFGVGGVFNGDYSEGEVLDYPIPHSSYFDLGEQQVGGLLSLDVLYELGLTDRVGLVAAAHTELGVLGGLTLEF